MHHWLINPWMLIALAGMALPILIAWLFRWRRQRIAFPAMRYLMNPKKRRRVRLQDLILLLIRTVVPGVLVIALARPLLRPDESAGSDRSPRHAVIVLDGTYSMGQTIGQTTAFEVAQTMAQDVVRGLPKDAVISFVYLGNKAEVLKERTSDHDSVHDAIGRAKISDMAGQMSDAIDAVEKLIALGDGLLAEVYLISDLQRSTWSEGGATRLAGRCDTFVLDTGGENGFNAYLTRFEPREKVTAVGMEVLFEVDVEAKNMPANGKLLVTLFADEDKNQESGDRSQRSGKIATREVNSSDLRDGRATVVFNHTFVDAGEHLLRALVEGDGLAIDNQQFYLASVPANVEVLIVDPRHDPAVSAEPYASNSGYLKNAVAPVTPRGFDRLSPFAATVKRPEDVLQLNLDRFAAVILTNVGALSDSLVSRLEQYVTDGGNLLIFAGDAVMPYEYNSKLLKAGKGLMPCELADAIGLRPEEALSKAVKALDKNADSLHALTYSAAGAEPHPAVANIRQLTRQPAPPSISRYMPMKLRTKQGELGRVVAVLSNQQPAVCEKPFGQGKVIFVNTSADASWNYLVYTGEYIVLLQELMRYLVGAPDRSVNLRMGQAFEQPVFLSSQYLLLRRPDLSKVRVAPIPQGNLWRVAFEQTDQQGVYEVDTRAEVMPRRRFVVNMAATEGDLTRIDVDQLRRELVQAGANYWGPDKAIQRAVEARHSVKEYAWLFLWALFVLLAVETLLAVRFGRRRWVVARSQESGGGGQTP